MDSSTIPYALAVDDDPMILPDKATFIGKPFSAQMVRNHLAEQLPDRKKPEPLKKAV